MNRQKNSILLFISIIVLGMFFMYNTPVSETSKDTNLKNKNEKLIPNADGKIILTEAQWKERLTEDEYRILRQGGTEYGGTGKYYHNKANGKYECAACGFELFTSEIKYDSGCGWPAFFKPTNDSSIVEKNDQSLGMKRVEIKCSRCDSHLGHVFEDGPKPTGLRYCVNSASLQFKPDSTEKK